MLIIGPHVSKLLPISANKKQAQKMGWGIFQTFALNPRSLTVSKQITGFDPPFVDDGPLWIYHSSYLAHAVPSLKFKYVVRAYFEGVLQQALKVGVSALVAHLGASKDKTVAEVFINLKKNLEEINSFLEIINKNQPYPVKFLVENCASAYPFNSDLEPLATITNSYPYTGWTLDLAHSNAAGVEPEKLLEIIEKSPPFCCHANYSGSSWKSSLDRHGFAYQVPPEGDFLYGRWVWKEAIKKLIEKDIPVIMEGSTSVEGDLNKEIEFVRNLFKEEVK